MSKITLIIKPTFDCNFKCVYCYNNSIVHTNKCFIDLNNLKKIIQILAKNFKEIKCIWLGGEPLLFGVDNFKKVFDYQDQLNQDQQIIFRNSVQSNGMLFNVEFEKLFKEHNVSYGVSYDGINTSISRGHGQDLLDKILYLKDANIINSVLYVLSSININDLIEDYEIFKRLGLNFKINRYIPNEDNDYLDVSTEDYVQQMFELFKLYYDERENNGILIEPFEEYISMKERNIAYSCEHGNCLFKYLCIDPMGNIYTCARSNEVITNINAVNNLYDIFGSTTYAKMYNEAKIKQEKCKNCEVYYYCGGGCRHRSLINNDSCLEFKMLFPKILDYMNQRH